jgi:hypothetical protein
MATRLVKVGHQGSPPEVTFHFTLVFELHDTPDQYTFSIE